MTPVQEILKWVKENSFNVTDQAGVEMIVVDVDEFVANIGKWLTDERTCLWNFHNYGFSDINKEPSVSSFFKHYDKLSAKKDAEELPEQIWHDYFGRYESEEIKKKQAEEKEQEEKMIKRF